MKLPKLEIKKLDDLEILREPVTSSHPLKVYPYFDEAFDLLQIAKSLQTNFDYAIDPFCGGGNSLLPIIKQNIAKRGLGFDINPRAVKLARQNCKHNKLENSIEFYEHDIRNSIFTSSARTLFIANPPFALNAAQLVENKLRKKYKLFPMRNYRDGGESGLSFTKKFLEETIKVFKPQDCIIGLSYSLIDQNGQIELESLIKNIIGNSSEYKLELFTDRKIWRGFDKLKTQHNPMPVENITLKADPENIDELNLYKNAIKILSAAGWSQIGYYYYIIY